MKLLSISAALCLVSSFCFCADDVTDKPAKQDQTQAQAAQEELPVGSRIQTSGKITAMHTVELAGNNSDAHTIVKLTDEQGDVDIVDLGSASDLKNNAIEPNEGQTFFVTGRVGKINDKFLIVAENISESRIISLTRGAPLREETVKHANERADNTGNTTERAEAKDVKNVSDPRDRNAPRKETVDANRQLRTIEGTVMHTKHIKIQGEADEHVFAKIQTENGVAVVDLGTCPAMPQTVNLNEGQVIVATGFVGQMNGKPIILADSVGNMSSIQRPTTPETGPNSNQPLERNQDQQQNPNANQNQQPQVQPNK
jgi:hypothetical protein